MGASRWRRRARSPAALQAARERARRAGGRVRRAGVRVRPRAATSSRPTRERADRVAPADRAPDDRRQRGGGARCSTSASCPALYRVHERPEPARVERLVEQLASLDVPTPPLPEHMTPQQAADAGRRDLAARRRSTCARTGHGRRGAHVARAALAQAGALRAAQPRPRRAAARRATATSPRRSAATPTSSATARCSARSAAGEDAAARRRAMEEAGRRGARSASATR